MKTGFNSGCGQGDGWCTSIGLMLELLSLQPFCCSCFRIVPSKLSIDVTDIHSAGRAGQGRRAGLSWFPVRNRPRRAADGATMWYRRAAEAGERLGAVFVRPALSADDQDYPGYGCGKECLRADAERPPKCPLRMNPFVEALQGRQGLTRKHAVQEL